MSAINPDLNLAAGLADWLAWKLGQIDLDLPENSSEGQRVAMALDHLSAAVLALRGISADLEGGDAPTRAGCVVHLPLGRLGDGRLSWDGAVGRWVVDPAVRV